MKILIVTQRVDRNDDILGFFHRWIEEFAKRCERVTVICLQEGAHNFPATVVVHSLGKERGGSRMTYLFQFYRFLLQEHRNYDAVFVHMNPVYVVLGGLYWRLTRKKVALWYTHKHVDTKLRFAEVLAHCIFTASATSFRLPSKKVVITGHGIDIQQFAVRPRESSKTTHLVTAGRISPVKDYETLLQAVAILAQEAYDFELTVIGSVTQVAERAYLECLKGFIQKKDLGQHVHFVGSIPNRLLTDRLAISHVFINMSRTGSLDKAVLEAMACGIPVLTSNEAFADILKEDASLLMFPGGNPGQLAQRIQALQALMPSERIALTVRLREIIVREHNLQTLIPRIVDVYANLS